MSKDKGASANLLQLLTSCLTIFGGIATILACVIAIIALANPNQTQEVIVQIFSEGTPTPLVITVVVTPTSPPGTATNTPQPTSTPEPTPTRTPTPTPTPISTTTPGTVLESGQTWYEDGLSLRMDVIAIKPDRLHVEFTLENIGTDVILAEVSLSNFRLVSNLGDIAGFYFLGFPRALSLQPGDRQIFSHPYEGYFAYNLANQEVKYVTIEVTEFSRIDKAQWRVDIPH